MFLAVPMKVRISQVNPPRVLFRLGKGFWLLKKYESSYYDVFICLNMVNHQSTSMLFTQKEEFWYFWLFRWRFRHLMLTLQKVCTDHKRVSIFLKCTEPHNMMSLYYMFELRLSFQYSLNIIYSKTWNLMFLTVPMKVMTSQVNPPGVVFRLEKGFEFLKKSINPHNMMSLYLWTWLIIQVLPYYLLKKDEFWYFWLFRWR